MGIPKNRLELSWCVTDIPHKIISNNQTLTYHQSKGLPNSWTPTFKNILIAPFIFKYDEPSSVYHIRYWMNIEKKWSYAIGISAAHLKPDELESGLYLGNGYNQIGPSFAIKRNIFPFCRYATLSFTSALSVGYMITDPVNHNIEREYIAYNTIIPKFMLKKGANAYQITGYGSTLYETFDLKMTKILSFYTGVLLQYSISKPLRSRDKINGEIFEEHFSAFSYAGTYLGIKFMLGWRKGTLDFLKNKLQL